MFDKVLEAFKQTVNYVHVYFIKRYVDDYLYTYTYIYVYDKIRWSPEVY